MLLLGISVGEVVPHMAGLSIQGRSLLLDVGPFRVHFEVPWL